MASKPVNEKLREQVGELEERLGAVRLLADRLLLDSGLAALGAAPSETSAELLRRVATLIYEDGLGETAPWTRGLVRA